MDERSAVRVVSVHLPALNTPQFDWSRLKFDRRPQPVPPIFQPEVAAQAIVEAAANPRREVWVGGPTVATILANRLSPGLLDRYLARRGIESQLTEAAVDPGRQDNLFRPVEGAFAAHGRFDDRAKEKSWQMELRRLLVRPFSRAGQRVAGLEVE